MGPVIFGARVFRTPKIQSRMQYLTLNLILMISLPAMKATSPGKPLSSGSQHEEGNRKFSLFDVAFDEEEEEKKKKNKSWMNQLEKIVSSAFCGNGV